MTRENIKLILVASVCLLVGLFGTNLAHAAVTFAKNSDKVDGKHAVGAGAGKNKRAGKLVATNSAGKLPDSVIGSKFLKESSPAGRLIAGGIVAANGTAHETGLSFGKWTVSQLSAGRYSIEFRTTDICDSEDEVVAYPVVSGTPLGAAGAGVQVENMVVFCDTSTVQVHVRTTNSANVAADNIFLFTIYGAHKTVAPLVPRTTHGRKTCLIGC